MKMYCEANSVRIVGKVWEVRTKLKQLCKQNVMLSEWLAKQHQPHTKQREKKQGRPSFLVP